MQVTRFSLSPAHHKARENQSSEKDAEKRSEKESDRDRSREESEPCESLARFR
ncbi:hypothetical protein DPMN_092664 [Dreissena polymorpha]|uniref:Uncharacterized protein n=1 Tax=Dreissena polymorpha TaxID=45954 RepID=A0A9D4L4D6_DREPO|nr:hypothetical protein DPMN_092664 [Dreissena polymorpha]